MSQRLSVKSISDALRKNRGMVAVAARNLGCARSTIYDWMEAHPELKTMLDDEREVMTDVAELSLYKQVQDGQGWAVQFYLKTQGKGRGYVETVNMRHGGDPDNSTPIRAGGAFTILIDRRQEALGDGSDNGSEPDDA